MLFPLVLLLAAVAAPVETPAPEAAVPEAAVPEAAVPEAAAPEAAAPVTWLDDYFAALAEARAHRRMLLIWFAGPTPSAAERAWQAAYAEPRVREQLARLSCVKLATDYQLSEDATTPLLRHSSFADLEGSPGLAIVDLTDPAGEWYRQVVSIFPFDKRTPLGASEALALLTLPRGSLTQRTLILAVRTYPGDPQSAAGEFHPYLAAAAARHAAHQAAIRLQGHHQWEQRFHQINAELPRNLVAQEVCAESWPGQSLWDAAFDCVKSWRQSPGHWEAVSRAHPLFGYDMQRGSNGIWYATGIFGRRR